MLNTAETAQLISQLNADQPRDMVISQAAQIEERDRELVWRQAKIDKLTQAPVPPQVIDKGIRTARLLAQVLVAKYLDHLPLYRQESIFERAGVAIARSTLAQWLGQCGVVLQPVVDELQATLLEHPVLHADETPVAMLKPGLGKTQRAYLWS